ncbi:MAG: hypothetical protein J6W64_05585 [Bacilli bacterium]|nr:hypothetical protein [Bacilli bacterium]
MSEHIFKHVKVIVGPYINRTGMADFTFTTKTHNVVFYPTGGYPYCVCLKAKEVIIDE